MAGTLLASSPHYFSAVKDYHACLMKTWLALATLRSTHNIPESHCNKLCTTSLRRKDSIFYANGLVTSMYWVVKWATLRKPKLIRIGPQGAPRGPLNIIWMCRGYIGLGLFDGCHSLGYFIWMDSDPLHSFMWGATFDGLWIWIDPSCIWACFTRWKPTEGRKREHQT